MENVYGQSEFERNSIVSLPDGYQENAGNTLYSWLGSLWHGLNKGDGMVRGLQSARGIRLAQLYLNILEAVKLQDRNGAPVFHRELWHPIVIRLSDRDKSQENMLSVGMDADIGPQPIGSEYGAGTVLKMGKLANFEKYVIYPIDGDIVGMSASIVDNIVNPSVAMEYGKDFELRCNSIIFPKENDPLGDNSVFEKYDVPGFDEDNPGKSDVETVLWASDVLIDKNYIADHISYALGANAPSTDIVKRILNAAWSAVTSGLTPELIRALIAAMLNVPVIQNDEEVVVDIQDSDDAQIVYTDKCKYMVSKKARLIDGIHPGCVMHKGDMLDESVRIYPFTNNMCEQKFSVPIYEDIPSVVIPPTLIHARTEYGVYAMWGESRIKRSEKSPGTDDMPHLYFDIGGSGGDVDAFWEDVWRRFDSAGKSMSEVVGREGDVISPAEFFLKNLVGANTLFVVVDRSQIDDVSGMRDPMFFGMLTSVVPSAIRLFLVEHRSISEDEMNLDGSQESTFVAASVVPPVESMSTVTTGEMPRQASCSDHVEARFVRLPPKRVLVRKEEE